MTYQLDVVRARRIAARGCALAEQRLEYLTELFETGRWRRFHGEAEFVENIKEAKTAVETWRDLSMREDCCDNSGRAASVAGISWLDRTRATLPGRETLRDRVHRLQPQSARIPTELPLSGVSFPAQTHLVCSDEAASATDLEAPTLATDVSGLTLDMSAIRQRYPLLRNAL
jgi:uncharacterized repeat protein (TIGR03809 family)